MSAPDLEQLRLLARLGRHQEAEQGLRSLLAGEPGNGAAMLMLADVLDDQGRHAEAEEAARRAVALTPDDEFAQRMLATVLAHNRKHDEAVTVARSAVQLAPQHWATHYTLGMVLRGGRRPRTRDALDAANQAVRLAPHESAAHNLAGMCLSDLGLHDLAHRAYSEALRLDPQSTMALNNMAVHQLETGRLKDASGFLTAGLSTDAQEKILHQNYDAILYKLMRRLFWTEVGFAVLIGILAGSGAPWLYRILAGITMIGVFVLIARGVLAGLPRGANRHALGLFRRTRGWMRYGVGIFVITTAAVLAMAMTPNDLSATIGLGMLLLFRTLGVIVIVVLIVTGLVNLVRRMIGR